MIADGLLGDQLAEAAPISWPRPIGSVGRGGGDQLAEAGPISIARGVTLEEVLLCGERIANVRQAFNVREGLNLVKAALPRRAYGQPPLSDGPTAGVTVKVDSLLKEYLEEMDWSQDAAIPSERRLRQLNLDFVASGLYEDKVAAKSR